MVYFPPTIKTIGKIMVKIDGYSFDEIFAA
jgi:hypothetical protein